MSEKKAMTLSLNEREMAALEKIALEKGATKTAIIKQALRLYQSMFERVDEGNKLYVENLITKDKAELMVL